MIEQLSDAITALRGSTRSGAPGKSDLLRAAGAYADACRQLNSRLAECDRLIGAGRVDEAVRLAGREPDLFRLFDELDFPERPEWEEQAARRDLPLPPVLDRIAAHRLRMACAGAAAPPPTATPATSAPAEAKQRIGITVLAFAVGAAAALALTAVVEVAADVSFRRDDRAAAPPAAASDESNKKLAEMEARFEASKSKSAELADEMQRQIASVQMEISRAVDGRDKLERELDSVRKDNAKLKEENSFLAQKYADIKDKNAALLAFKEKSQKSEDGGSKNSNQPPKNIPRPKEAKPESPAEAKSPNGSPVVPLETITTKWKPDFFPKRSQQEFVSLLILTREQAQCNLADMKIYGAPAAMKYDPREHKLQSSVDKDDFIEFRIFAQSLQYRRSVYNCNPLLGQAVIELVSGDRRWLFDMERKPFANLHPEMKPGAKQAVFDLRENDAKANPLGDTVDDLFAKGRLSLSGEPEIALNSGITCKFARTDGKLTLPVTRMEAALKSPSDDRSGPEELGRAVLELDDLKLRLTVTGDGIGELKPEIRKLEILRNLEDRPADWQRVMRFAVDR